jgi:RNA polymerase sigma factor (sigma-70 family)
MSDGRLSGVLRQLSGTVLREGGLSDGQLLERFLSDRDEAAFEALVRRHGPMVLGVCRRVLGNSHDADDAFQASFLALARKAGTLSSRELVGHWLFAVAYRTAMCARRTASRRRAMEKHLEQLPERPVIPPESLMDLRAVLDREVSRLPAVYRIPVVLCELEGKSRQEAARQLGVPEGTLSSRLARARELLRKRLVRSGVTLTGAALVPALAEIAAAAVPAALLRSTVKSGVLLASGQAAAALSAPVAALLRAILRKMTVARFWPVFLLALVGLVGLAAGLALRQPPPENPPGETAATPTPDPAPPGQQQRPGEFVRITDLDRKLSISTVGFIPVNGELYFTFDTGDSGQLWKCAVTPAGVMATQLTNLPPNVPGSHTNPSHLTNAGGTLYFVSRDGTRGLELWKSDGTPAGTVPIADINPGGRINPPPTPGSSVNVGLMPVGKTLFFVADDGRFGGCALRKTDGTKAGTSVVKNVNAAQTAMDFGKHAWADVNGTFFFGATEGVRGQELWKSDGTEKGTVLIKDIRAGEYGSDPCFLTNVNGTLFFTADDGVHGRELWRSDGTPAGTRMVKDINPGKVGSFPNEYMGNLINVNGTLFFAADDGIHGLELWKSDGTEAGTVMVKDIHPGPASSVEFRRPGFTAPPGLDRPIPKGSNVQRLGLDAMVAVGKTLFFVADDGVHGYELWKSDGTAAGTVLVKDIARGAKNSDPIRLTNVNGTLYFQASDGVSYKQLWKSDGTKDGTIPVKDFVPANIPPIANGSPMGPMTAVDGGLFLTAVGWGPEEPFPGRIQHLWYMTAPRPGSN